MIGFVAAARLSSRRVQSCRFRKALAGFSPKQYIRQLKLAASVKGAPKGMAERWQFWALALLWLPAGVVSSAAVRFGASEALMGLTALPMIAASLVPMMPCGLPLALGCRWMWRLGYRRTAWIAGAALAAATVAATLIAGLLGPVAIAVVAIILSLPAWALAWWLRPRA